MKMLKSKVAGMTDLQYTKRYNLIKQVANKRKVEAARDAEITGGRLLLYMGLSIYLSIWISD